MRRVLDVVRRAAKSDATVLVSGESGTGKELVARAVHVQSDRVGGPFIAVNCKALAPGVLESELFGHERGAFTGAERARPGLFERAHGGTLFLDEIGETSPDFQAKLLRVLQERRVTRVGGSEERPLDFRVVAATNRDLKREVEAGTFREDLYFRLAVVVVDMPPLRERPEDIALYVDEYLADSGSGLTIDDATRERLVKLPWPGNVRELRNFLERAAALGEPDLAPHTSRDAATLTSRVDAAVPYKTSKALLLEEFERAYVVDLMARHDGNITRAARAAEIDRVYLLRLLDKFGLRSRSR